MSELPIAAFPPPAGLAMVGDDDAGACVDGVCMVPPTVQQQEREGSGSAEDPNPSR